MRRQLGYIAVLVMATLLVWQCKVDPAIDEDLIPPDVDPSCEHTVTPYELEIPTRFPSNLKIPDDNPLTVEGIDLGRHLFYDPILSIDSNLSCGGCHAQSFAFTDNGLALSETAIGETTKRNAPPMFNAAWMNNFFWDGRSSTMEDVILDALLNEQHVDMVVAMEKLAQQNFYSEKFDKAFGCPDEITEELAIKAMAQFINSIVSSNSKFDLWLANNYTFTPEEELGYQLFITEPCLDTTICSTIQKGADCFHCHFTSPLMTDNLFHNNGLDSVNNINNFTDAGRGAISGDDDDYGRFKTPTLRNLAYTAPYMHDGRFATLEEVIDHYDRVKPSINSTVFIKKHLATNGLQLTQQEKDALIAFLNTMNDPSFLTDERYSNPFD